MGLHGHSLKPATLVKMTLTMFGASQKLTKSFPKIKSNFVACEKNMKQIGKECQKKILG